MREPMGKSKLPTKALLLKIMQLKEGQSPKHDGTLWDIA